MDSLQVRVPVRAPAAHVWQALTDWNRQGEWMLATTVRTVGPQRRGPGDRFEAFTGFGPLGFLDTIVVTEWVDQTEVTVQHTGRVVRGSGTFRVEPIGSGASTVVVTEHLTIPGGRLGALAWRLGKPLGRWGIRQSLRRFARQMEADPAAGALRSTLNPGVTRRRPAPWARQPNRRDGATRPAGTG